MLFDLQGRRRRVVQATYLGLAVLMGGGLLFFGIGGDVQGGLFDAFGERGGTGGGTPTEDRLEKAEERARVNPRDQAALAEVARQAYQLATEQADPDTGAFGEEARANLEKAGRAWERYLALEPEPPDANLARIMVQAYDVAALNDPAKAARAAELVAEEDGTFQAFIQVLQYATLAGQTRKAELAGRRAVEVAPPDQRKTVKEQVEAIKAAAQAQAAQAAQQAAQQGGAPQGGQPGAPAPGLPGAPAPSTPPAPTPPAPEP